VLYTHALIWYLQDNPLLSDAARAIFQAAERGETRLHVSAISIAEMYYANQKYRWFQDFAGTFAELKRIPYIRLVAFEAEDVMDFGQSSKITEMHDRIIVGLAQRLDAPLLTADRQITTANITPVVW
jgi:PIN domain nuclease of toxin-antitoxin system